MFNAWSLIQTDVRIRLVLTPSFSSATPTVKISVDETVASTDLQNPADALEFLAHVAERDSGGTQLPPMHSTVYGRSLHAHTSAGDDGSRPPAPLKPQNAIDFAPLTKGLLSLEMIQILLYRCVNQLRIEKEERLAHLDADMKKSIIPSFHSPIPRPWIQITCLR